MWQVLMGKILVHIGHPGKKSQQGATMGKYSSNDSKLEQVHRCLVSDKNEVPVIICLWWPFKIMSSPKELPLSG